MESFDETLISEMPESWVIVKTKAGENTFYRVFGTWAGGYLESDRWKLNSGIDKVKQDNDYYYFIGLSGSCYKCHKKTYGTATSFGLGVLNDILKNSDGKITMLDDMANWATLFVAANQTNSPIESEFVWQSRYSITDQSDKHGRWARLCFYRGFLISWINRIEHVDMGTFYTAKDFFPSSGHDMPIYSGKETDFAKAKEETERRFGAFINVCV